MTYLSIIIPGSIRSKKNSKKIVMVGGKNVPRRPIILPSEAYQRWQAQARLSLKWAPGVLNGSLITGPCAVKAIFYYSGNRPDLQGCMESLADCLQGYIWLDDRQIESWDGSRLIHDKDNPRTEIEVTIL